MNPAELSELQFRAAGDLTADDNGAEGAGIVMGTRVPIVLTSRADSVRTRLASTAVMAMVAHALRTKKAEVK